MRQIQLILRGLLHFCWSQWHYIYIDTISVIVINAVIHIDYLSIKDNNKAQLWFDHDDLDIIQNISFLGRAKFKLF